MYSAFLIVSILGGFGAAWLWAKYLKPWHLAAWEEGGPRYHRVDLIYVWSTIGAFFVGIVVTQIVFLWLG